MGKLNDSLLSGSSGRTGRLVVANVSGTEILRVRPRKSSTKPSAKQVLIQDRMKMCYDFIMPYKAFASVYFGYKIGMRSCYNQAITNLLNAYKLDYVQNKITPEYPEIMFSMGALLAAVPTGISSPAAGTLQIDWYNNAGTNIDNEVDQMILLFVAEGAKSPILMENLADRKDATTSVSVPPNLVGKKVHAWITFRSQNLLEVSVSSYVGSVTIS